MLNGKSWRRRQIRSRLFAIALSLIVIGKLSASVMRIDGGFEDWKDVKVCAYDPRGDAKGEFDITKVYAASQGSILYLRFDTASLLNLQNGPEAEGTLLVIIDLPNNKQLILDTRGRRAFLNDSLKERIPWDRLKYLIGPTALVKRTSDHHNRLLPDTAFIISSVAYEDNRSVILSDQSHQATRSAPGRTRTTPKMTPFSRLHAYNLYTTQQTAISKFEEIFI